MTDTSQPSAVHEIRPRYGQRENIFFSYTCRALAVLFAVSFHVFIELAEDAVGFVFVLVALFFDSIAIFALWEHRRVATRYVCDDAGIRQLSHRGDTFLQWHEIRDIRIRHAPLDKGEYVIDLYAGDETMRIRLRHLEKGGRSLVELLFRHLPGLFASKLRRSPEGEYRWNDDGRADKSTWADVLRLDDRRIRVRPGTAVEQTIPLPDLRRVEWLPGSISPFGRGRLVIDHAGGRIVLPHNIDGLLYFLYALEYHLGLGDLVNPGPLEETDLDRVRASVGWWVQTRLWGIGILIVGGVFAGLMAYVPSRYEYVRTRGQLTDAVIAEKLDRLRIRLEYRSPDGDPLEKTVFVTPAFHDAIRSGDGLRIRIHPTCPLLVHFEGYDTKRDDTQVLALLVLGTSGALVGWVLIVLSSCSLSRQRRRMSELEERAGVPRDRDLRPDDDARR